MVRPRNRLQTKQDIGMEMICTIKGLIIKILTGLERRVDQSDLQPRVRKYKKRIRLKNTIDEMKNTLEGMKNRLADAKVWLSNPEDRRMESTQVDQQK